MVTNQSKQDSNIDTPAAKTLETVNTQKPIAPIRQRLMVTWLVWLAFRLLALPILISVFNPSRPDIVGGIAWQALWFLPALVLTPSILRGRSPYALLISTSGYLSC